MSRGYLCETEPIGGQPYCVDSNRNYVVIEKDSYEDKVILNLTEIDLYEGTLKLNDKNISVYMSSTQGKNAASNCIDDDLDSVCESSSGSNPLQDFNPFIVIDVETLNFDKVIVTNSNVDEANINGATLRVYHQGGLLIYNTSFLDIGTSLSTYNFDGLSNGVNPTSVPTIAPSSAPSTSQPTAKYQLVSTQVAFEGNLYDNVYIHLENDIDLVASYDDYTAIAIVNMSNIVIDGNGHRIDGQNSSRCFYIMNSAVHIFNLTVTRCNSGPAGSIWKWWSNICNTFLGQYDTCGDLKQQCQLSVRWWGYVCRV